MKGTFLSFFLFIKSHSLYNEVYKLNSVTLKLLYTEYIDNQDQNWVKKHVLLMTGCYRPRKDLPPYSVFLLIETHN